MTPLNDPAIREAFSRYHHMAGTSYPRHEMEQAEQALVTALCAWQRAQDVQALRSGAVATEALDLVLAGFTVTTLSYEEVVNVTVRCAIDHLEALK